MKDVIRRISAYQPATWWAHFGISVVLWWAFSFGGQQAGMGAALLVCLYFGIREGANFEHHALKGHSKLRWILDGFGDLVGPLSVAAYAAVPWATDLPIIIGCGILGLTTLTWTAMYGSGEES